MGICFDNSNLLIYVLLLSAVGIIIFTYLFFVLFNKQKTDPLFKNISETERFLKNILESSIGYSIIATNMNGKILAWNKGARLIYGYTAEEMLNKNIEIITAPEEIKSGHLNKLLQEASEKGEAEGVLERIRKDGSIFTASITVTLRKNISGDNLGFVIISKDITKKKKNEERIANSESFLQSILEGSIEYSIIATNMDGNILTWNKGAENNYGYTSEEMINKYIGIITIQNGSDIDKQLMALAKKTGKAERVVERLRKDGSSFTASVVVTLRKNKYDDNLGFVFISKDITKQNRLKIKITESYHELQQFAYVASHDLKAPLRAIVSLIGWIDEDKQNILSADSQRNFKLIIARAQRMENLIDGILQYSRAGHLKLDISEVDIRLLIEEILESMDIPENVTVNYADTLPVFKTAKIPLIQIFSNLISNAIKYNDKSFVIININVKNNHKFYEFSVSDNGPGIEEEYHEKIFEIFHTLQSRDIIESTGIGLSIVKKLVEAQGGKVRVDSVLGEGTTFSFTWPKVILPSNNMI